MLLEEPQVQLASQHSFNHWWTLPYRVLLHKCCHWLSVLSQPITMQLSLPKGVATLKGCCSVQVSPSTAACLSQHFNHCSILDLVTRYWQALIRGGRYLNSSINRQDQIWCLHKIEAIWQEPNIWLCVSWAEEKEQMMMIMGWNKGGHDAKCAQVMSEYVAWDHMSARIIFSLIPCKGMSGAALHWLTWQTGQQHCQGLVATESPNTCRPCYLPELSSFLCTSPCPTYININIYLLIGTSCCMIGHKWCQLKK